MATTKKAKTVYRNLPCVCPHCNVETKVPGNGLYHCCNCGHIFSVDLAAPAKLHNSKFSGVSITAWLIDDLGLYPADEARVTAKLNVHKPLPFGANLDGVTPIALISALRERGATVESVGVRAWGFPKSIPSFDEDERLVVLLGGYDGRWIAVRKFDKKFHFIDPAGKVSSMKDILDDRGPQLVLKVGRRFHSCPLRMA